MKRYTSQNKLEWLIIGVLIILGALAIWYFLGSGFTYFEDGSWRLVLTGCNPFGICS